MSAARLEPLPSADAETPLRLARIRKRLGRSRYDAFLTSEPVNLRYLTGFTGSNGCLLVEADRTTLLTDGRYGIQARDQTSGIEVVVSQRNPLIALADEIKKRRLRHLCFERNRLAFEAYEFLRGKLARRRLEPVSEWVEDLRAVKSPAEIGRIRRSIRLNSEAFEQAIRAIRPAWSEARLAAEIDHRMRLLGAEAPAFDTIVASGGRSALPHAQPARRKLETDSLIVVDQGAILDGYASDMTRMICLGRVDARRRELFRAVLEANRAAIDAVSAGVAARTADAAARRVLRAFRLGRAFPHSTGHGLGLEIHEAPRIAPKQTRRLKAGMVVTIEPGAYLEGIGGVRIEDVVLVTANGCEVLTRTPRGLRRL